MSNINLDYNSEYFLPKKDSKKPVYINNYNKFTLKSKALEQDTYSKSELQNSQNNQEKTSSTWKKFKNLALIIAAAAAAIVTIKAPAMVKTVKKALKHNNLNKIQAKDYLVNFNKNNKEKAILDPEKIKTKEKELTELSEKAQDLTKKFSGQINEAKEQIDKVFCDKSDIEIITARPKGQKSVFSKLAKKNLGGENLSDIDACYKTMSDALGTRLQMKNLHVDVSRQIVDDILSSKNINASYDDFVKYLNGDTSYENVFKNVKSEILDTLKTKHSQGVVNQIVSAIKGENKDINLNITRISNYGDEATSYFTDKQVAQIVDAYNYAVENKIITSNKALEVVSKNTLQSNNVDIDLDSAANFIQQTKGASKKSGYISTQMNIEHKLADGTTAYGELQIRGPKVNQFAQVEHIPYDIKSGKIYGSDIEKYSDIYESVTNMTKEDFGKYNSYLSDTYKTLRMKELGLFKDDIPMPKLESYGLSKNISSEMIKTINAEGLMSIASKG